MATAFEFTENTQKKRLKIYAKTILLYYNTLIKS